MILLNQIKDWTRYLVGQISNNMGKVVRPFYFQNITRYPPFWRSVRDNSISRCTLPAIIYEYSSYIRGGLHFKHRGCGVVGKARPALGPSQHGSLPLLPPPPSSFLPFLSLNEYSELRLFIFVEPWGRVRVTGAREGN